MPWHGFGNGFIASNYFQMHSCGGIAKSSLSIPIIAQRWSRKSRVWKGCNVSSQAKISVRTPAAAPRALVVGLGLTVGSASPHEPRAFNLRGVDGVRVSRMVPHHENFQGIEKQNGCSFLLMY